MVVKHKCGCCGREFLYYPFYYGEKQTICSSKCLIGLIEQNKKDEENKK